MEMAGVLERAWRWLECWKGHGDGWSAGKGMEMAGEGQRLALREVDFF